MDVKKEMHCEITTFMDTLIKKGENKIPDFSALYCVLLYEKKTSTIQNKN